MKLNELIEKFGSEEAYEALKKELQEKFNVKRKLIKPLKFEPMEGEIYWFISDCSEIEFTINYDRGADALRCTNRNCFKTQEEAKFISEKISVITELKEFAEEHNEYEIDWENAKQHKYFLIYNPFDNKICFYTTYVNTANIYFTSKEVAGRAIKAIGEKRLKIYYFEVEE